MTKPIWKLLLVYYIYFIHTENQNKHDIKIKDLNWKQTNKTQKHIEEKLTPPPNRQKPAKVSNS